MSSLINNFRNNFNNNLKSLLNIFLESNCPLCEGPTSEIICPGCTKKLYQSQISEPSKLWQEPFRVFGWGKYGGVLKRAIFATKYNNQPQLAKPLGYLLGEAWLKETPINHRQITVIPIPMHSSKEKQRGYNQAALIAKSFCEITGLKLNLTTLERSRSTEAQYGLNANQREKNLHNAFQIKGNPDELLKSSVLLLDDIYTTGATAKSAMLTLRKHKINVLGLVAVAIALKGKSVPNL